MQCIHHAYDFGVQAAMGLMNNNLVGVCTSSCHPFSTPHPNFCPTLVIQVRTIALETRFRDHEGGSWRGFGGFADACNVLIVVTWFKQP